MQFLKVLFKYLINITLLGKFFFAILLSVQTLLGVYQTKVQHIHIVSKKGCILSTDHMRKQIKQHVFDVTLKNGHFHFNGKSCSFSSCMLHPFDEALYCNGLRFECPIRLKKDPDGKHMVCTAVQKKAHVTDLHTTQRTQLFDKVRVLLDTIQLPTNGSVHLASTGSSCIISDGRGSYRRTIQKPDLYLQVKNGRLMVNGKRFKAQQLKCATRGHLTYKGCTYSGSIYVVKDADKLLIINEVPLEDYICSVLRTESWPGWPLEVNKVFAITSRTYVISMMQEAFKAKRPYHVHNCNKHQTYSGVHDQKVLQDAVHQTRGIILTYDGNPIIAMFDSCCGGVVPAHVHTINFNDAPYLARTYPCTHCKKCWIYRWKAEYTPDELCKHFMPELGPIDTIKQIRISKKDKAGLAQEIHIKGHTPLSLTGQKMYHLLKEVKSYCYTICKQNNRYILHGRGYGHHLGLCQWGAREMVRDGWDYKRILKFYYPNTTFMRFC